MKITLRLTVCPVIQGRQTPSFLPKCSTEWPAYDRPSGCSQHGDGSLVHVPASHGNQGGVHTEAARKECWESKEMETKGERVRVQDLLDINY